MTAVRAIARAAIVVPVIGALEETADRGIEVLVIVDRAIVVPPAGDRGNVVPAVPIADLAIVVPVSAAEAIRAVRAAGLPAWVAEAPAAGREWGGSVQ